MKYVFKTNYIIDFINRVGISKEQFIKICEIDNDFYEKMMNGYKFELTEKIARIIFILNVPMYELFQ